MVAFSSVSSSVRSGPPLWLLTGIPAPPRRRGQSTSTRAGRPMRRMASHCAALMSGPTRRLASSIEVFHLAAYALANRRLEGGVEDGRGRPPPASEDDGDQHEAAAERGEGHHPHEEIEAPPRRGEQYPLAVLLDEVVPHLARGLSRGQALADDPAHLMGG